MNFIKLSIIAKLMLNNVMASFSGFGMAVVVAAATFIEPFTVNLIACGAAFATAGGRWVYFGLSPRKGIAGMLLCPMFAFCFAAFHPVVLDNVMHTVNDENYALMLGATVGIFPTFVFGFVQDVLGSMKTLGVGGVAQGVMGIFKKFGGRA